MTQKPYVPLLKLTRGVSATSEQTTESIHFGAIAVVESTGRLIASCGDPYTTTYLRSSAKPFQALPFIENGGQNFFNLSEKEIALICASHSGTDEHVMVVHSIQNKSGIKESDLLCGVHPPIHEPTAIALREQGRQPTPNRHMCSGKHTGMLAFARMLEQSIDNYIDNNHLIQKIILKEFSEMCDLPIDRVKVGTDGCSAPNFAVPLYNAALAYARICDPEHGQVKPDNRAQACQIITNAMINYPNMVAGPDCFDTRLMEVCQKRILSKGGAEGYQGIGLFSNNLRPGSYGIGIAIKISDGDSRGRAVPAITLETLRQLEALSALELNMLQGFGPTSQITNWRKLVVGQAKPVFKLL